MKDKINKEDIPKLIAQGYCRTSRRFGLVSRIDRKDWKEFCHKNKYPIDADWYRRCLSKDTLEVGVQYGLMFPASHDSEIEYVERK